MTVLLPKEHGAYGQILFPLATAFGVAGLSTGGVLIATTVVAGFLAHEPAAIVLGLRGPRARRELSAAAAWSLAFCLGILAVAAIGALLAMDPGARWSLAVPLCPALVTIGALVKGREKTARGEVSVALAFSGAAVPIAMAAGVSLEEAVAVAIPFALLFVASTLAVRAMILRVRGGGNVRAMTTMRRSAMSVVTGGAAALVTMVAAGILETAVLLAAIPGLLVVAAITMRPPAPGRLRTVGWSLVAASFVTASIVVASV